MFNMSKILLIFSNKNLKKIFLNLKKKSITLISITSDLIKKVNGKKFISTYLAPIFYFWFYVQMPINFIPAFKAGLSIQDITLPNDQLFNFSSFQSVIFCVTLIFFLFLEIVLRSYNKETLEYNETHIKKKAYIPTLLERIFAVLFYFWLWIMFCRVMPGATEVFIRYFTTNDNGHSFGCDLFRAIIYATQESYETIPFAEFRETINFSFCYYSVSRNRDVYSYFTRWNSTVAFTLLQISFFLFGLGKYISVPKNNETFFEKLLVFVYEECGLVFYLTIICFVLYLAIMALLGKIPYIISFLDEAIQHHTGSRLKYWDSDITPSLKTIILNFLNNMGKKDKVM